MPAAEILIIEDNHFSLQLMAYLLETANFIVNYALNGEEGLEMVKKSKPDLIILDIHLPRIDGYKVAKSIKALPSLAKVPLVAVTAMAMVGDREKILNEGFDFYISKPIQPETFVKQIQVILKK